MDKKTKIILIGGGVLGLGLWWWLSQGSAQASLAAHVTTPVGSGGTTTAGNAGTVLNVPVESVLPSIPTNANASIAVSSSQTATLTGGAMTTALLNWAKGTANPALYEQMINQASATDIAGLYNLLTTYWAGTTTAPTAAQVAFWNNLRVEYPFLNNPAKATTLQG